MKRSQGLLGGVPRTGNVPIFDGPHLVRSAVLRGSRPMGLLGVGIEDGRFRFNEDEAQAAREEVDVRICRKLILPG